MKPLYDVNGLMFWTENEIRFREYCRDYFSRTIQSELLKLNKAWQFSYFEGPILTPSSIINPNYTEDDIFVTKTIDWEWIKPNKNILEKMLDGELVERRKETEHSLVLRPETTPSSYHYANHLLKSHQGYRMPLCVWQAGKSFRREQDQVVKNMRLKEFYQQEFQCIFSPETKCDYFTEMLEPIRNMIQNVQTFKTRLVPSDRLPDYSSITMDIEVDNGDKWMEVCSISKRKDFEGAIVLEIAIGLDRIVYNSPLCFG